MANLIITLSRQDTSKEWFKITTQNIRGMELAGDITPEEATILLSYGDNIKSLPGFMSSNAEHVDDYTIRTTISFDSLEAAMVAKNAISNPQPGTSFYRRNSLLSSKHQQLGLSYTRSMTVETTSDKLESAKKAEQDNFFFGIEFFWSRSGIINLSPPIIDLVHVQNTYIIATNTPSGQRNGAIGLSYISSSINFDFWELHKRININFKNTKLLEHNDEIYFIGTEQDYVTIYTTSDGGITFKRVTKFFDFYTDTSTSRVRKLGNIYIVTLTGGFLTFDGTIWNLVKLSHQYKEFKILDSTLFDNQICLLCQNNNQYKFVTYSNNNLIYSDTPFSDKYLPKDLSCYGMYSSPKQLIILGKSQNRVFLLCFQNGIWVYKGDFQIEGNNSNNWYFNDATFVNGAWIFVGMTSTTVESTVVETGFLVTAIGDINNTSIFEKKPSPLNNEILRILLIKDTVFLLGDIVAMADIITSSKINLIKFNQNALFF